MDSPDHSERLSRLATRWSLVKQAHAPGSETATLARAELAQRYLNAVYRYLRGALADVNAAEELCQEFFVKLMEGKLQGADPGKGRFRDYLKVTLINLVNDHHRRRRGAPDPLPAQLAQSSPAPKSDAAGDSFLTVWREELIERTWVALREQRAGYYDILRLRIDEPDLTSRELAQRYESAHNQPLNPATVRKRLERAHHKFADLLVAEVARSLEHPDVEALRDELTALDLMKYCGGAVTKWQEAHTTA